MCSAPTAWATATCPRPPSALPGHAADEMVRRVMEAPGEITLIAQAALTNIALAYLREPRIAQARQAPVDHGRDRQRGRQRHPADWAAIPLHEPIIMGTVASVGAVILAALAWVTVKGYWPYLWREWITSVDHKRIGVMYLVLALIMLVRGFAGRNHDATRNRRVAAGGAQGYLPPEHFDQIFSAHGTIMIFFVAMPLVIGLMNFAVPLQLGVRDVAFPTMNSVSLWLTATGILLINVSLFVGEFAKTGWVAYPPLSELQFSPGVGVDYYLWSLQISGIGTLLSGVNFVTTILKMRAPGMSYMRMPVFLLDGARLESADRGCISGAHRAVRDAAARPLPRLSLLHAGRRRQRDDVRQPVLGQGPPRSLHPGAAGIRHLFGGERDLFRQAAVRLPLDGRRDHGDLRALLHGVAASFLHHGRKRQRERLLRHHQHDHRRCRRASKSSIGCSRCTAVASGSPCRCCGRSASW